MADAATSRLTRAELGVVGMAAFVVFSRVFGLSLVLPGFRPFAEALLPVSLAATRGGDVLVGLALSGYAVTLALMQLPLGILSDRIGRKPVLLGGTLAFAAGSLGAALATDIWTLLGCRLLQGLGAVASVAMATVGETVPAQRRTTAMALVGIPAGLGFMLGLAAGAASVDAIGTRGLFLATAGMGLLSGIPVMLARYGRIDAVSDATGARRTWTAPVVALMVAGFATNYALTTVVFFLPDVALGMGAVEGVLLVALAAMAVLARRADRTARPFALGAALLVALPAGAALFALGGWGLAFAGGALFFTAHATLSALLPSQVSRLAGRAGGRGHGWQMVCAFGGSAAAGPVAGLWASEPAVAVGVLAAVAALGALALFWAAPPGGAHKAAAPASQTS